MNLEQLILSFNEINAITGIDTLEQLTHLDISFNFLTQISDLPSNIEILEVNNNKINTYASHQYLEENCPNLTSLKLFGNPICSQRTYRDRSMKMLPNLELLDGQITSTVYEEDYELSETQKITKDLIRENSGGIWQMHTDLLSS